MRKLLFLFSLVFMLASCDCCHKKEEVKPAQQDSTVVADSVIKADLDSMVATRKNKGTLYGNCGSQPVVYEYTAAVWDQHKKR